MLLAPLVADPDIDKGMAPDLFHLGNGWFDPWRAAYLTPGMTACDIAGLPMIAERARLGPIAYDRLRSQTNVHTALFDLPQGVAAPDQPSRLLAGRNLVTIDYLTADARLLRAARAWPDQSRVRIAPHAVAPLADCRAPYAAWLARRSRRGRKHWPALSHKLIAELGMRFTVEDVGRDLPALIDRILEVEQSGWKGRERTAIRDDPRDALFYTDLARRAAAAGALRIATLSLHGRIIAFEYGVLGGDRLFLMKVGYDEAYEEHSIGHGLSVMHIEHCCGDPAIAWYDKMGNGMTPAAYKLRFNDTLDTLYRLTLYGAGWRGRLLQAHDAARMRAKTVRDAWRSRAA